MIVLKRGVEVLGIAYGLDSRSIFKQAVELLLGTMCSPMVPFDGRIVIPDHPQA